MLKASLTLVLVGALTFATGFLSPRPHSVRLLPTEAAARSGGGTCVCNDCDYVPATCGSFSAAACNAGREGKTCVGDGVNYAREGGTLHDKCTPNGSGRVVEGSCEAMRTQVCIDQCMTCTCYKPVFEAWQCKKTSPSGTISITMSRSPCPN